MPGPPPGVLPNPGIKHRSLALQADSLPSEPPEKSMNIGMGSLSLLQGIFQTQELNWGLMHCRWILYQLSYQGSPLTCIKILKKQNTVMIDTLSDKPYCSPQILVRRLSEAHLWNSRTLQPVSEDVSNRQLRPLKIKRQRKSKGLKSYRVDFPGGTVDRNPPAKAEDMGSVPGLGRFHMLQSN